MNLRRLAACALPCLAPLAFAAALLFGGLAQAQTTLSANLAIRAPGSDTTATWSGGPSPSSGDWLGLFAPGAPNWAYVAWRYTSGTASGSVPFTIPSGLAHGTYELRFLSASQGHVATSNPITVSMTLSGTITMSGSGVAAVTIGGAICTESNSLGQYACAIPSGWSGTLTPAKTGHAFSPASRNYTNVTASQAGQGYTANITYQLSGTLSLNGLPLANVAMGATTGGSCTTSDPQGQYTCTVLSGWTGTVTPSQTGYSFSPSSRNYSTPVAADDPGEDYSASLSSPTSNISFIHVDHLNTPRLVADAAGTTVWRWDQMEPFGVNVADEDPDGNSVAFEFPYRYAGQYADKETNLHYNFFRDYEPATGRFVQADPIGLRGGMNLYANLRGDPLTHIDPTGEDGKKAAGVATQLVGTRHLPEPWWVLLFRRTLNKGGYTCNLFVYDTLQRGGDAPPPISGRPPFAGDWAGGAVPGYTEVKYGPPQLGDVVAADFSGPNFTGHVGVFVPLPDGSPGTISVRDVDNQIVHNDWGFRPGQKVTIMRCNCDIPYYP